MLSKPLVEMLVEAVRNKRGLVDLDMDPLQIFKRNLAVEAAGR